MSRTWTTIPLMMCGIGSDCAPRDFDLRGDRVDVQREADHDGAEVERADLRARDRRRSTAARRCRGRPGTPCRACARARVPTPASTIVCPISLAAGHEGSASSWAPLLSLAASMSASGQNGIPVRLPVRPGRQGRRESRDLLFAVFAHDAQVERAVGASVVVFACRRSTCGLNGGTPPEGQAPSRTPLVDLEWLLRPGAVRSGADHGVRSACVV